MALSPKLVKLSLKTYLKSKSISYANAAEILGIATQTLANLLSSQTYFSMKMATRFHEKFGFNKYFLMTGEENLLPTELPSEEQQLHDEFKEKKGITNVELVLFENILERIKRIEKHLGIQ